MKFFKLSIFLLGAVTSVSAGKFDQAPTQMLYSNGTFNPNSTQSVPNSSAVMNFTKSNGESWDLLDDPSNMIGNCLSGSSITGLTWDVTLETVGGSWLSEAVILFSDTLGSSGTSTVFLTVGVGDSMSGTASYSSGGYVDFTDNGIPDVVPQADGLFQIQFFESFDDVSDAIDANFTGGSITVWGTDLVALDAPGCDYMDIVYPIPVANNWYVIAGLMLALSLVAGGFIRARAK